MSAKTGIKKARKIIGKVKLAREVGISYQAMDRWVDCNEMPATEYNGKTKYSMKIEELTEGKVTITELLGFIPQPQSKRWKGK